MIAKLDKNHNSRKGNDGRSISVDWWRSQGRNLQYTLTQRKEMERQAQDLRLSEGLAELGILKSLEGKIIGYLKAEEEFSPELARYSSFRIDLDQAREVATTLTTIIQEKVRDYGKYVRRRIIAVVPKLQEEEREQKKEQAEQPEQDGLQPKKQRAVEELAHLCQNYASLEQVDVRVIPRRLLNPYFQDLGELAGLASREVQGIKERYLAASTVEEITAIKTKLEETVVKPFLRKRDQLQQKYSFQYTARLFPCWREYRALEMERPREWQELSRELEIVARNPEKYLAARTWLQEQTARLEEQYRSLSAAPVGSTLGLAHLQQIRAIIKETEEVQEKVVERVNEFKDNLLYWKAAGEQYRKVHDNIQSLCSHLQERFLNEVQDFQQQDYRKLESLSSGKEQLRQLKEKAQLLEDGAALAELTNWEEKFSRARQGYERFHSPAGLQAYVIGKIQQQGWPADQEKRQAYALISGIDSPVEGPFWSRMERLSIPAGDSLELMARAAELVS